MSIRTRVLIGLVLANVALLAATLIVARYLVAGNPDDTGVKGHANRISLAVAVAEGFVQLNASAAQVEAEVQRDTDPSAALERYQQARVALQQQADILVRTFGAEGAPLRAQLAARSAELDAMARVPMTRASADALVAATAHASRESARTLAPLVRAENTRGIAAAQDYVESFRASLARVLAAVGLALALSVGLSVLVYRRLVRPLADVSRGLNEVLAGRPLRTELSETADEFGDIVRAIRKLRAQGEHIKRLAYIDGATGLPNRNSLDAELRDVHRLRSSGGSHGLVLLGIDTYNNARNAFGVRFAEEMMRSLVRHFGAIDKLPTTLFRYDAATFAVLVDRQGSLPVTREDLKRVAAEAFRRLSSPAMVGTEKILVSASVGAALFPDDARDPDEMVNICGEVLRQARAEGTGQLRFGQRGLTERLRQQLSLSEQIRVGIRDGRFEPFFQPIVDVETGRVAGAEILVRWRHPDGRVVLPGEFIVVAEETELIRTMTDAILIEGCRVARGWMDNGLEMSIAFNLSARMLTPNVVDVVRKALDGSGLPPMRLIAEVTETALLGNLEEAHYVMEELRKVGVRLCLDDFGSGFSSLSHLYRFSVDRIKIDPLFCRAATSDPKAAEIIRAMVELSRRIDIQLIAEGIETLDDVRAMRRLGCRYMQGFQFSPALPGPDFFDWARRYPTVAARA